MDNHAALAKIAREIEQCQECQVGTSGKAVPGEGNPDARVVFIGEAPGKQEAKTGRPFVGRSGQFLRSLLKDIGLQAEDVYITSGVKYLPDRGKPNKSEIAHGRVHLQKQLAIIDPEIVVLLGSVASEAVLGTPLPIMKEHGKIIEKD